MKKFTIEAAVLQVIGWLAVLGLAWLILNPPVVKGAEVKSVAAKKTTCQCHASCNCGCAVTGVCVCDKTITLCNWKDRHKTSTKTFHLRRRDGAIVKVCWRRCPPATDPQVIALLMQVLQQQNAIISRLDSLAQRPVPTPVVPPTPGPVIVTPVPPPLTTPAPVTPAPSGPPIIAPAPSASVIIHPSPTPSGPVIVSPAPSPSGPVIIHPSPSGPPMTTPSPAGPPTIIPAPGGTPRIIPPIEGPPEPPSKYPPPTEESTRARTKWAAKYGVTRTVYRKK